MYFCTLLKVVSHYDLSVLSMSVIGFQFFGDRWVGNVLPLQIPLVRSLCLCTCNLADPCCLVFVYFHCKYNHSCLILSQCEEMQIVFNNSHFWSSHV